MLTLVKFMIEHGFYSNIDDLEELIDPLIDLLNGTNDNLHDNTDSLKKAPSSRKHSSHLGGRENNE